MAQWLQHRFYTPAFTGSSPVSGIVKEQTMFKDLESQGILGVYEVGGKVRDELLGLSSKDIDYAVEALSWEHMRTWVTKNTKQVFLEKPEFLTIRALTHTNDAVDFVMCRKDGAYSDSRRPDEVTPGTIYDDLARRDFTVNAIAKNLATGEYLDPWNGRRDIYLKRLSCVGDTMDRLSEDPLRVVRAIRFWVTKNLIPDSDLRYCLQGHHWQNQLQAISVNRRREELERCLKADTIKTISIISSLNSTILDGLFSDGLWLKPTLEK